MSSVGVRIVAPLLSECLVCVCFADHERVHSSNVGRLSDATIQCGMHQQRSRRDGGGAHEDKERASVPITQQAVFPSSERVDGIVCRPSAPSIAMAAAAVICGTERVALSGSLGAAAAVGGSGRDARRRHHTARCRHVAYSGRRVGKSVNAAGEQCHTGAVPRCCTVLHCLGR